MREFDSPGLGYVCSRKCAFFIAEQLALEKRTGYRRTVDFDKLASARRRVFMNPPRKDLFPCPSIAIQQNRNVGITDLRRAQPHLFHGLGLAEQNRIRR